MRIVAPYNDNDYTIEINEPILSPCGNYRISKKGKFQWLWPCGHKRTKWVTWARIVRNTHHQQLIINWKRTDAMWTEKTVSIILHLLREVKLDKR